MVDDYFQDSFPLWFRSTHVVNAPRFFRLAYTIVRPMLAKAVQDSIIFHPDMESLWAEVDKEILPEELGGALGKFSNIECREALEKIDNLLEESKSLRREVTS